MVRVRYKVPRQQLIYREQQLGGGLTAANGPWALEQASPALRLAATARRVFPSGWWPVP